MGEGNTLLFLSASRRESDDKVAEEKSDDEGKGEMTHFWKRPAFSNMEIGV
jgi:hypothetical protein